MRHLTAACLLLCLAAGPALAADEEAGDADPIDTALGQCLDAPDGQSTAGMVQCLGTAYDAWDAALNGAYRSLMDSLDPAQKEALKGAQRQWIAWREGEKKFLNSLANAPGAGSIVNVTANQAMVDMVKARVLLLRMYREN